MSKRSRDRRRSRQNKIPSTHRRGTARSSARPRRSYQVDVYAPLPQAAFQPQRAVRRQVAPPRPVVTTRAATRGSVGRVSLPSPVAPVQPSKPSRARTTPCQRRVQRREVLHAIGRANGNHRPGRKTPTSFERC